MEFDVKKVSGIGEFVAEEKKIGEEKILVYEKPVGDVSEEASSEKLSSSEKPNDGARAFLVVRKNTLEVRSDRKLAELLREKYESVMESRYFGRGGIEIVNSGQLSETEIEDLVRMSYNLS